MATVIAGRLVKWTDAALKLCLRLVTAIKFVDDDDDDEKTVSQIHPASRVLSVNCYIVFQPSSDVSSIALC